MTRKKADNSHSAKPFKKPASRRRTYSRIIKVGDRDVLAHGLERAFWKDFYHLAMTASWPRFFVSLAFLFLCYALFFAGLYALAPDSIANRRPDHFADFFFFSVETLATVGYGDMHPQSDYGHIIATLEIFSGLFFIAIMTGLVFARFSRPDARLIFARNLIIGNHNGARMLMVRMANARHNMITGATAKLWLSQIEYTLEGQRFRKFYALKLARDENPVFALSWMLFHPLDETSLLYQQSQEDLIKRETLFVLTLDGYDETARATVHARHSWTIDDLLYDHHYVDILDFDETGLTRINYHKFHQTIDVSKSAVAPASHDTTSYNTTPHETTPHDTNGQAQDKILPAE